MQITPYQRAGTDPYIDLQSICKKDECQSCVEDVTEWVQIVSKTKSLNVPILTSSQKSSYLSEALANAKSAISYLSKA